MREITQNKHIIAFPFYDHFDGLRWVQAVKNIHRKEVSYVNSSS